MKSVELLQLLECIGPLSISADFCKACGAYDNSGIIADSGEDITGVLFSLDLSEKSLIKAKELGFNAIVTHHPAIYGALNTISVCDYNSKLIAECLRCGITVISMHLNFDAAPEGIDYHLMRGLGGDAGKTLIKLQGGAYGRVYDIKPCKLRDYVEYVKSKFNSQRVIYYGDGNRSIARAASFCGAGCDDEAIAFADRENVDLFVSSDMKHHQITALLARNITVVILTHYSAENYGFNRIYSKLIEELNIPAAYFCDADLM